LENLPASLMPDLRKVESAEVPRVLTQHLAQVLQRALTSLKGDSDALEVVNQLLLALIQRVQQGAVEPEALISGELRELLAVVEA